MIPFFTGDGAAHLPEDVELPYRRDWRFGLSADLTNWARAYGQPESDPAKAAAIVLSELNKQEPLLAELKTADQKTKCRFNLDYDHWATDTNVQARFSESYSRAKAFIRIVSLRANAEVAAGQTGEAMADIELMCLCDKGLVEEPLLISQLVGFAGVDIMLRTVAQGLAEHRWTDAQLKKLQVLLGQFDMIGFSTHSVRGERNVCVEPVLNSHYFMLPGWNRMEEVNLNHALEDAVMPCLDPAAQRINLNAVRSCEQRLQRSLQNFSKSAFISRALFRHDFLASTLSGTYPRCFVKSAYAQTSVSEVLLALALERCRLAEGKYPESLAALVPRYVTNPPHDVMTGQPFIYRLTGSGKFILYSVGWNGTDDGGKAVFMKAATGKNGPRQDYEQGDWVFQYPD